MTSPNVAPLIDRERIRGASRIIRVASAPAVCTDLVQNAMMIFDVHKSLLGRGFNARSKPIGSNYLAIGGKSAIAIPDGDPSKSLKIEDAKALAEIRELVRQRQELGQKITRALKNHGFNSADDSPTATGG